jgi:hypothetical protein
VQQPDISRLRESLRSELQQDFADKESQLKNDIVQLTIERDEKDAVIQEKQEALKNAGDKYAAVQEVRAELDAVRKEKTEIEAELKIALCTAHTNASSSSEAASLKDHLQQKTEDFQSMDQELTDLKREHAALKVLCEQQQVEISQHPSTIETMRQEAEAERTEVEEQSRASIQRAQNQAVALQNERDDLQSKLEHAQTNEANLNNAQATVSNERDDLRSEVGQLRTAKVAVELRLSHVQQDTAEKVRQYAEDKDDLARRLARSEAELKEAAANNRLQETQYREKLDFDRKRYESIIKELGEELEKVKTASYQQQASQSTTMQESPSRLLQNIHASKNRKKVNRRNHSVLDIAGASGAVLTTSSRSLNTRVEGPQQRDLDPDHDRTLFDEGSERDYLTGDQLDDQQCSIVDPTAEAVTETGQMTFSAEDFDGQLIQMTRKESPLSAHMPSDDMDQLRKEVQLDSTAMLRGQGQGSSKQPSDNASLSGSQSSRSNERPRSQANTASRMMPPPGSISHHLDTRKSPQMSDEKAQAQQFVRSRTGGACKDDVSFRHHRTEGDDWSSPDYMQQNPSASKYTYTQHDARPSGRDERAPSVQRQAESADKEKRKNIEEMDLAPKRQRTSSQSSSSNPRIESRTYAPHSSRSLASGSRSKPQLNSSLPPVSSSTSSRSRNQPGCPNVATRSSTRSPSSSEMHKSRSLQLSSARTPAAVPSRRTPARQTKNKCTLSSTSTFPTQC